MAKPLKPTDRRLKANRAFIRFMDAALCPGPIRIHEGHALDVRKLHELPPQLLEAIDFRENEGVASQEKSSSTRLLSLKTIVRTTRNRDAFVRAMADVFAGRFTGVPDWLLLAGLEDEVNEAGMRERLIGKIVAELRERAGDNNGSLHHG